MIKNFFCNLYQQVFRLILKKPKGVIFAVLAIFIGLPVLSIAYAKIHQSWDRDPTRGAIAIKDGVYDEKTPPPIYLKQGWSANDSLWFYNTTQGSALLPYDFLLALEQLDSDPKNKKAAKNFKNVKCKRNDKEGTWFLCPEYIDRFRYLPQKSTFFNPDALPVGFVKETYKGKDYVGYTCAACHTAQIDYEGKAIRIDGGPAMADMVTFLTYLNKSMKAAQKGEKWQSFFKEVLALNNDYNSEEDVKRDLQKWTNTLTLYNTVNHSNLKYGNARLDAFGRIYNRVLQHVINKEQLATSMAEVMIGDRPVLTNAQIEKVLEGVSKTIIRDDDFAKIVLRLASKDEGYPGLSLKELLYVRNKVFNPPNAPVSYPFLWDIAQSDYVQWNGIANNAPPGPLGRNAGEVIGVFGILDWKEDDSWFGLSSWFRKLRLSTIVSGQTTKKEAINFDSSIDLFNLGRLEKHLQALQSPKWPGNILGKIDTKKAARGKLLYAKNCRSCHEIIDRSNSDRKVISNFLSIKKTGTDKAMAKNSVGYTGKSGNFSHTYQATDVGKIIVPKEAPAAVILTAATKGVVATPDPDKWFAERWVEFIYTLVSSFTDNDIKANIKTGNYDPDTTSNPFASLLSYKARSLNGIWATAPYLHNGSVPTLYDLLKCSSERPKSFMVGTREFNPVHVGFITKGYEGFEFKTHTKEGEIFKPIPGNNNSGHEYNCKKFTEDERWELVEYLKTL